jgi:putative spermidine/putrescine transport system permease protein
MATATAPASETRARAWNPVLGPWRALLLAAPLIALLAMFVVYPLVKLGIDSVTTGDGLGNYKAVFESAAGRRALYTTAGAAILVAALSVAIGGLCAWYIRSTRSQAARVILWLAVLMPFWMGTVTKNYAIVLLFAQNGALNQALDVFGIAPLQILYTPKAVVIGMVYTMVPYAAVSLYGVFVTIDESLPAAAQSMGATRARALRTIVLPLAMPGLVASTALVFAISLGFYVTPVLLGGAQAPFMASFIQDRVLAVFDYPAAAAASVILLVTAIVILAAAIRLVGRERLLRAVA